MLVVETIAKIRRAYFIQGKAIKQICRELRVSRNTVRKVVRSGATEFCYDRWTQPRPKIDPWRSNLDEMLAENDRHPNVHAYPVESRYGLVWIWMGDPAQANTDKIFTVVHFDDPDWRLNKGEAIPFECNYLLIIDNLLDPSHVAWVHQSSFGTAACEEEPLTVTGTDSGVIVSRWMYDVEVAPFYQKLVPFEGKCDREQHYEVGYPSLAYIKAIFTPAGTGGDSSNLPEGQYFQMDSYNFMTPEDESTTRYYWFQIRNILPGDTEISDYMSASVQIAFNEDRDILIEVQKGMNDKTTRNIDIAIDAGPLLFRRRLQKLIEMEQQANTALAELAT